MKNFKNICLFLFATLLFSCSDASDEDLGLTGEGTFTAKVDGATFTSLQSTVGATITGSVAAVQGSTSSGEYIRFNIVNYSGIGTYTTGNAITNANLIQYGTVNPIAAWISTMNLGNGTIEITEETNTTIKGTFSFTGINASDGNSSKTITEGSFNAVKN